MWTVFKIVGEIIVFFGFLYGLCSTNVISSQTAITIGVIGVIFILCYSEQQKFLEKSLSPIKFAVIEIQTLFREMGKTIQYSLTETHGSPLKPTEFGWKLIKDSGMDKIIGDNKKLFLDKLNEKLAGVKIITGYDVQEKSREIMIGFKNDPLMKSVKDYVFNNAIEIEVILRLGGILLRDEYLKNHPEIK